MAAAMLLCAPSAGAVEIITTTTGFNAYDFNAPGDVCEVTTTANIVLGKDDELYGLDIYFANVTDASGLNGFDNSGQPVSDVIGKNVYAGQPSPVSGFASRSALSGPLFMTIYEGLPDPNNAGQFVRGQLLAQIPIPQSTFGAGFAPCLPLNEAPTADAGPDQSDVVPGATVSLDAGASSDPDNDALSYVWTQVSGPAVTLSDPTSANPTFTAPGGTAAAPIVFSLKVNDGTADSGSDTVTISVLDNVTTAKAQIGEFLTQRNVMLLSHQPDVQRRIDRLQGRTSGASGIAINGMAIPGTGALPFSMQLGGGNAAVRGSLSEMRGRNAQDRAVGGTVDIWFEGYQSDFDFGGRGGRMRLGYAGIDYAVSSSLLLGVMGQLDDISYDGGGTIGVTDGEGWLVGPYATVRLAGRLFLDVRGALGESTNSISPFGTYTDEFRTQRALVSASLTGEWELAKRLFVRPEASVAYIRETQKAYVDGVGSTIGPQNVSQGQLSIGPRVHYNAALAPGWTLRPFAAGRLVHAFGNNSALALGGADRFRFEGGVDLLSNSGPHLTLGYFKDGIGVSAFEAEGWRASVGFSF